MKKLIFGIIVMFPLFLFSCKEKKTNIIEGQITAYPNNQVVKNAHIKLEATKIKQGSYLNTWELIGETESDNEGKYSFKFDAIRVDKYKLTISQNTYKTKVILFSPKDFADTYQQNICLVKGAVLKIHLKNEIQPNSALDTIRIRVSDIPDECTDCSPQNFQTIIGIVDTALFYQVVGDDDVFIEHTIIKEDSSGYHQEWMHIEPNQANIKTISY